MSNDYEKSAAEIEREIENDRERIGEKLSAIQDRLTPGQMIDEALGYMKSSGGAEYFGNLGNTVKANPMPLALMGVSLAWLMMGSGSSSSSSSSSSYRSNRASSSTSDYPLATVSGSMRRTGPPQMENGQHYAHFTDTAGKRYRAMTDSTGRRMGDFMDDAGLMFRGFADSTGRRITDFRDETGSMIDDALGWAADTWHAARDRAGSMLGSVTETISDSLSGVGNSLSGMGRGISSGSSSALHGVHGAVGGMGDQATRLNDMIMRNFRDQPLVAGALAFAAGAAIGAALPHTAREDDLMGDAADSIRDDLGERATDLMDQGKQVARDVYEKAVNVASELHDTARDRIVEEGQNLAGVARPEGSGQGTGARM
jgi:hypothetical protein